ncbi:MAG: DNA-deoxyinosine glycosylase [Arenicellales bacterium]
MTQIAGFEPIIKKNCRVLVLGSMPGVASLQQQQYYAHPRNAFWPIMEELLAIDNSEEYAKRCSMLSSEKIALWDVLKSCKRTGSLDSRIETNSEQANDFDRLFTVYDSIRAVFFNGGTAERLYKKHILRSEFMQKKDLLYYRLPSTSPAYASMTFDEKLGQWRRMLDYLSD